ncbi:MAG: acyl-CoA thioesterase [Phycisphaerae bacterium]|nr:acyl-CoA thioesterase [Phycisphaerae bacterium]
MEIKPPPSPDLLRSPDRPVPREAAVRLRVRYCECDPMGVAHHSAYVPWLEIGRTEILRDAGVSYARLEAAGVFLAIVRLDVRYRRPACYDDLVEVRARVVGNGRVKIEHHYEVVLVERPGGRPGAPGDELAVAASALACVDASGRPTSLPDWLSGTP